MSGEITLGYDNQEVTGVNFGYVAPEAPATPAPGVGQRVARAPGAHRLRRSWSARPAWEPWPSWAASSCEVRIAVARAAAWFGLSLDEAVAE